MVFQVMVVNLWSQDRPSHHHANRATTAPSPLSLQSRLCPTPLFMLIPRKATSALALEFE